MNTQNPCLEKLSLLDKRIGDFLRGYRQNIAILGNDEEEISYLLAYYFTNKEFPELIRIHTTTNYANAKSFAASLATVLLRQIYLSNESLDLLLANQTNQSLPITISCVHHVISKSTPTLLDVLEIINCYVDESKKKCLLIVEEFDQLVKIFPTAFKDFSKFIMLQRSCMVLVTASLIKEAQKVLSNELNLLFGNFEKIYTNEITFLETYQYFKLTVNSEQASPLMLAFLTDIAGGANIAYCDILAQALKKKLSLPAEEDVILSTLRIILYNKQSYLFQKFINKIDRLTYAAKDTVLLTKILIGLSKGYLRKCDLLSLNICQSKDLSAKLMKLQELNYIDNYGNIYKITDALFAFWLSTVYASYYLPACADTIQRQHIWQAAVKQAFAVFKEDFVKSKIKKVSELISLFKDDTLTIGNDKYRLPAVQKTKIMTCDEGGLHILVTEGKEIIFAGINEHRTEENDIAEFIIKGRSIKGKKVKKIFISLDRFTPAAKLIAKNNKLIAWDVNKINRLLKIYNKSFIPQTEQIQT